MEIHISKKTIKYFAIGAVACILVYWLISMTDHVRSVADWIMGILSPFIIGSVLAFILNVPMRAIERRLTKIRKEKIRRAIALVIALVAFLLVLSVVFVLMYIAVEDMSKTLIPRLESFFGVGGTIDSFLKNHPEIMEWVYTYTNFESINIPALVDSLVNYLATSFTTIIQQTVSTIGSLFTGIMNAFISIAFAIYALFQKETLARQGRRLIYSIIPEKASDYIVRTLRLTNSTFSNFLSGQCLEVCILGCMFAISMLIFGMPHVALISILIAVTAFIPIVGAWVGCIVGAFLIFVSTFDTNPLQAVFFVALFLVLQEIENNLIYPKVVGNSIGLPGMWVLVAVAFGGQLMGVAGMFLMIPIVSVVYILLKESTAKRLSLRSIDPDKLVPQPPELRSTFAERFRANRKKSKSQRKEKKSKDKQSK